MSLARAARAKDPAARLVELLAAWRATRHPRVADLIDRVDAKLLASAKRITAKSTPARAAALINSAKTKDPTELTRDHFGLTFDEAQVGNSGTPRPLGDEPLVALQKLTRSRRDSWLSLARRGHEARLGVSRTQFHATLPVEDPKRFFAGLLALSGVGGGKTLSVGAERYDMTGFEISTLRTHEAAVKKATDEDD